METQQQIEQVEQSQIEQQSQQTTETIENNTQPIENNENNQNNEQNNNQQTTETISLHDQSVSQEEVDDAEIEMDVELEKDREEKENERNLQFNHQLANSYWVQQNPIPFVSTTTTHSNNCQSLFLTMCFILVFFFIFLPIWWIVSLNKDRLFSLF